MTMPTHAQPQPKQKRFGFLALGVAIVSSLIVGSCTAALASRGGVADPEPAVTITVTAPPAEAPAEKKEEPKEEKEAKPAEEPAGVGDGTHEVGADIQPGRYKTVVPDDAIICSYQRLKDDSGDSDSIITIDVLEPGSKGSVTIKKSDGFFDTSGCGEWQRVK